MKILRIIDSFNPDSGGPVKTILDLCTLLEDTNTHTDILCQSSNIKNLSFKKTKVINLNESYSKYGFSIKLFMWTYKNIEKYDLIIIHGLWQFHNVVTFLSCIFKKKPYVIYAHGMLDNWFNSEYRLKRIKKKYIGLLYNI